MPVVQFENQEKEYFQWLERHPKGYVITTYKTFSPNYIGLHTATCRLIRLYMRHMAANAFTGSQFKKVCSGKIEDLRRWAEDEGYASLPACKTCKPK